MDTPSGSVGFADADVLVRDGPMGDPDPFDGPPATPWWRRRRWVATLRGAIGAIAVIAAFVVWMPQLLAALPVDDFRQRAPDYVLALESVGVDEPPDPHGVVDSLGLSTETLRRYEDFRSVSVWSGETRDGASCLLVARPDQGFREGLSADECSSDGSDTVAGLVQGSPGPGEFSSDDPVFAGVPIGGRIRFVLRGDHVDVYVPGVQPTASRG